MLFTLMHVFSKLDSLIQIQKEKIHQRKEELNLNLWARTSQWLEYLLKTGIIGYLMVIDNTL